MEMFPDCSETFRAGFHCNTPNYWHFSRTLKKKSITFLKFGLNISWVKSLDTSCRMRVGKKKFCMEISQNFLSFSQVLSNVKSIKQYEAMRNINLQMCNLIELKCYSWRRWDFALTCRLKTIHSSEKNIPFLQENHRLGNTAYWLG